jgi:hypothetical protein
VIERAAVIAEAISERERGDTNDEEALSERERGGTNDEEAISERELGERTSLGAIWPRDRAARRLSLQAVRSQPSNDVSHAKNYVSGSSLVQEVARTSSHTVLPPRLLETSILVDAYAAREPSRPDLRVTL